MSDFFPVTEQTFKIDDQNEFTARVLTFEERMIATARARALSNENDQAAYIYLRLEMAKIAVNSWKGPAFAGVKCTPANIGKIATHIGAQMADDVMALNMPDVDDEDDEDSEKKG